jgi:hypothetical protein
VDKMKGPFKAATEEAPAQWGQFSKFGKGGEVIESTSARADREKRNADAKAAADEANAEWKAQQKALIESQASYARAGYTPTGGISTQVSAAAGVQPRLGGLSAGELARQTNLPPEPGAGKKDPQNEMVSALNEMDSAIKALGAKLDKRIEQHTNTFDK